MAQGGKAAFILLRRKPGLNPGRMRHFGGNRHSDRLLALRRISPTADDPLHPWRLRAEALQRPGAQVGMFVVDYEPTRGSPFFPQQMGVY